MLLGRFFSKLGNCLFPPVCILCRLVPTNTYDLCHSCWNSLTFISSPFCKICGVAFPLPVYLDAICTKCMEVERFYVASRSILKFDQHSKKLIHNFKYYDQTYYASFFAKLIVNRYRNLFLAIDYVVPVPMHKLKRLYRNYNQAQLLASKIAELLSKPIIVDLLIKKKWTKSQTLLARSERIKNINGSIAVNNEYDVRYKSILLVDDVCTTGSTRDICSKILKQNAKVNNVFVTTIAIT